MGGVMETLTVNGASWRAVRLLGKGKGGYSWLAERDGREVVVKQIHHEPCDYYQFGDKLAAERNDYRRLREAGIRVPEMLDVDVEGERIVKEYVEGETIAELLDRGRDVGAFLPQVREMAARARAAGLNIDYYPANFVVRDGVLWYVDYECNPYSDEWSFENWGIRHWLRPGGPE